MVHFPSGFAYRNPIFADGKIIFVCYFDSAFFIQVNKRLDLVLAANKYNKPLCHGRNLKAIY